MSTIRVGTTAEFTAALKKVMPGDTLLLTAMSYAGGLTLRRSGRDGQPIVIRAENPGAIIGGGENAFTVTSASWIKLIGLTFANAKERGLSTGGSHQIALEDCLATGNGQHGYFFGNTNEVSLLDCDSLNNIIQHGIYFSNGGDGLSVVGGRYCNNGHAGIETNGPGNTRRVRIRDARFTGNGIDPKGAALNFINTDDVEVDGVTVEKNGFGALNMNGSAVRVLRSTIKMPAGAKGNCLNVGNGSDCHCEDLTVQMGRPNEPWANVRNSQFSEINTTVLPVTTAA